MWPTFFAAIVAKKDFKFQCLVIAAKFDNFKSLPVAGHSCSFNNEEDNCIKHILTTANAIAFLHI